MTRPRPTKTIPIHDVRTHLARLVAEGWTQQRIADTSGYSKQTIHNIRHHNQRINRLIALDLLDLGTTACAWRDCRTPAALHDVCPSHLVATLDAGWRAA